MRKRTRKRPGIVRRGIASKQRKLWHDDDPLFEEHELEFSGGGDERAEPVTE